MEYIVSMTSFGERLVQESIYSINSILQNSILPTKIVVVVNRFDENIIPSLYKEHPLIEIIISDLDIRSHNKYYHTMIKYPEAVIITIDDDVEYPNTFIEDCINAYNNNPNVINACRVHKIKYKNNTILPYRLWEWESKETEESFDLFFTGVGGVVYPPKIFKNGLDIELIKQYIEVDDILLNYLCRLHCIKVKRIKCQNSYKDVNIIKNKYTLCRKNLMFNNDTCLKKIKFDDILNICKQ